MSSMMPRMLDAFRLGQFRLLWGGTLFGTTAFMTSFLLVPIVAYEITGSYTASGIAQMGSGVSMLLLGPIGGVIADRYAKKPLALVSQIVPGLIILGTGLLVVTDVMTIWMLFLSSLLMGVGFALMGPARQAWLGELVPKHMLSNGIALTQVAQNISQVLGPMLGSILLLIFAFGSGEIYFLVAGFFLITIPLTIRLPNATAARSAQRRSAISELGSGFRYLRGNARLRILWGYWMAIAVLRFASQTLLPGFIEQEFGVDASDTFILYLVVGVVALIANVPLASRVTGPRAWPMLIGFGVLMSAVFVMGALTPSFFALMLVAILVGISTTGVMLVNQALIMTNTRPEYFGRVMSFVVLGFAAQTLIAPIWGVSADAIGGRETMVMIGMIVLAATALLALGWLRTRGLPLEAGTPAAVAAEGAALPPGAARIPPIAEQMEPIVRMGAQKALHRAASSRD